MANRWRHLIPFARRDLKDIVIDGMRDVLDGRPSVRDEVDAAMDLRLEILATHIRQQIIDDLYPDGTSDELPPAA